MLPCPSWHRIARVAEWHAAGLAQRFEIAEAARGPARTLPLDEALEAVLRTTGYLDALEKSGDPDAADRAENVRELVHDASVFGREQNDGDTEDPESRLRALAGFLEHCRSMRTASESLGDEARVTLSTLHRAKGLEFDTVIIAGFSAAAVVPFAVELCEWQTPSFLRQCYATSATTSSGGASASRAPTRYCRSR